MLKQDLPWLKNVERAKRPARIPLVLTRAEVKRLLSRLEQQNWLTASLLYGAGLRLRECLSLRVEIWISAISKSLGATKGNKDRITMLPASAGEALKMQLANVKGLHLRDLADGFGRVHLLFSQGFQLARLEALITSLGLLFQWGSFSGLILLCQSSAAPAVKNNAVTSA